MPPRPLYRWKSFWLGVFVVVFLGWAWVRSMKHSDSLRYGSSLGAQWLVLAHDGAVLEIGYGGSLGATPEFYIWHSSNDLPSWGDVFQRWFPTAIDGYAQEDGRWSVSFAHWFLILLFLLPWTTWLVWRSRRMKRLD
jgi:hypothetical protein